MWPTGEDQPCGLHSELAGWPDQGQCRHCAGGVNGAVRIYVTNTTDVVLDIDGYFVAGPASTLSLLSAAALPRGRHPQKPTSPLGVPILVWRQPRDFSVLSSTL